MIEALLYAAVGFFVAALLALAIMSMLWQRAVRLTHARIEASAPTTLREMTAIRDALRAENAVSLCRMEQGLDRLRTDLTAKTIGFRKAQEALRIARLEAAAAAERHRELEADIAARQSRINVLEDNLTKTTQALKDASRAMRETEAELRALESALNSSESLADSRKVEVAALKTRISSLEGQLDDWREQASTARSRIASNEAARAKAEASLDADANELRKAYAKLEDLQGRLANAAAQAARREQQMADMEARLMAYEKSNTMGNPSAMNEETSAYLKDKLAQYVAELASFTSSVEGQDGRISQLIAQNENAGQAGDAPLTLADRIRLIAGKTQRH